MLALLNGSSRDGLVESTPKRKNQHITIQGLTKRLFWKKNNYTVSNILRQ